MSVGAEHRRSSTPCILRAAHGLVCGRGFCMQLRYVKAFARFDRAGYLDPGIPRNADDSFHELGIALCKLAVAVIDVVFKTNSHVTAQQHGHYCRWVLGRSDAK